MKLLKHPHKTYISFAYESDFEQLYAFYCARYENISINSFLNLGVHEFMIKFNSMPESEPLHNIIKSRVMSINKIKDKEERKYWRELKRSNAIPSEYIDDEEIIIQTKEGIKEYGQAISTLNDQS